MPQMRATMSMTSSGVRPDDQPLEVARRLEDLEVRLLDDAVPDAQAERALALDPGQVPRRRRVEVARRPASR